MKLSILEARKLQLHCQGLRTQAPFGLGKKAIVQALRRLSYVQIDTISVVERAHHHVFWSRVPNYQKEWLHELQSTDKKILEYWSHAAAYLPIEDYRYCLPRMIRYRTSENHWWPKDKKQMKKVLERIRKEGPLLARDFENTTGRKAGPWFDRTPSKRALEQLFQEGRLSISERRGFQKVYELSERYLPNGIQTTPPTMRELCRHLISCALTANGFASSREIAYLRKGLLPHIETELHAMKEEELLESLEIEGLSTKFFAHNGFQVPRTKASMNAHILSPFDNLVIQRARLKTLFNFDYQIECYVPEVKRKFGYFVLPVLVGDEFVAKLDAKADRAKKTFIIKALHFEKGVETERFAKAIADGLKRFGEFNGCESFDLKSLQPKDRKLFNRLL